MSNDRHDYEIHEDRDDFGDRRHRGPRGPHEHRGHQGRGRRTQGDNPWEQIFGADGPFGPRGPFGKSGLFGPQGADMARAIWENATAGGSAPAPQDTPWAGSGGEGDGRRRGRRGWGEEGEFGRPGGGRGRRRGGPDGEHHEHGRRGPGGPGGRRGRRPKGDVRLAALLLIAEEPRNGYQIIEELASRTSNAWKPSSGAVYPALAQLEDEGLIEAFENEGRKAFRLTEAGRQAVDGNEAPAPWETATADASEAMGGRPGGEMWQAFGQVAMAAKAVSATRDAATMTEAAKVLEQTRRSLYRILADGPQDLADETVDAELMDDES